MSNISDISDACIKGIITLILAICGNYVGETLTCHTQRLLINNMAAKHLIIILSIFVALVNTKYSPYKTLAMTMLVYIIFILVTRMNNISTITAFVFGILLYFTDLCIKYYKDHEIYIQCRDSLVILFTMNLITGFIYYMIKKNNEKKDKFDIQKFIFGIRNCALEK